MKLVSIRVVASLATFAAALAIGAVSCGEDSEGTGGAAGTATGSGGTTSSGGTGGTAGSTPTGGTGGAAGSTSSGGSTAGGSGGAAGEGGCQQVVPSEVDALLGHGDYLPDTDAAHFCKRGYVTFNIVDVPGAELQDAQINPGQYYVLFALSNTTNRNYHMSSFVSRTDAPYSELVVKPGGGSCIDCECCSCRAAMGDGWCASEIARLDCPGLGEGDRYRFSWDSDAQTMCLRRGSGAETCFADLIPAPFAFNRYCGGDGCAMMHWGAGSWTGGTVEIVRSQSRCEEVITETTESCP